MVSLVIKSGPFRGKWIKYLARKSPVLGTLNVTCVRCPAATSHPGVVGWFYRQGELGRYGSARLCPDCLAALGRPGS